VNKIDIAYALGEKMDWGRSYSLVVLDALLKLIIDALLDGEEVRLSGLGVLYTKNPHGEDRSLEFRQSLKFIELLGKDPVDSN
jgi:nucleoid DNA-binding protein